MTSVRQPDFVCPAGDEGVSPAQVARQVETVFADGYRLGRPIRVELVGGGYMNWSFKIVAEGESRESVYFVRKYNASTRLHEIRLEHALVTHAVQHGLDVAARVRLAVDGKTWVTRRETVAGRRTSRHYAVFDYLPGEAKYSWCFTTKVTPGELLSCAQTLAEYHAAVTGFDAGGLHRAKPPIMQYLPLLPTIYAGLAAKAGDSAFDRLFLRNFDAVISCVERAQVPTAHVAAMPTLVCHGDFHPGNMQYRADQVVALFDFDFCHTDLRMFDIGHALHFFCFSWEKNDDGSLDLDVLATFLRAYQDRMRELNPRLLLTEIELMHLPEFVHAGNLFTLDWDIQDFYADPSRDVDEYVSYLLHNLRMIESIDSNWASLQEIARSCLGQGG